MYVLRMKKCFKMSRNVLFKFQTSNFGALLIHGLLEQKL